MPQVDIDFQEIRPLGGQRSYAFEEFCVQLARRDSDVPAYGSQFVRLEGRGGDGGVECYWRLADGSEWGYQAKLLARLDKEQLSESVRTGLRIHPQLKRYVICLPFDLTGPTGRRGHNQQARWDEFVSEWETLARDAGMQVRFERWGKSELLDRLLAIDVDGGRRRYWFGLEHLGREWFEQQLADAIADAGPRYHPELNVAVPLGQTLAAFGKSTAWSLAVSRRLRELDEQIGRFERRAGERESGHTTSAMAAAAKDARQSASELRHFWVENAGDAKQIANSLNEAAHLMFDVGEALRQELESRHGEGVSTSASFRQFHAEYQVSFPAEDFDRAQDLHRLLTAEIELLQAGLSHAMTSRVLLVTGIAGAGKTHAICDAAQQRLAEGLFSIVVLGDKLGRGPVLDQVREMLGLPGDFTRDALLTALDAAAEASGGPLILFFDALNEREPRDAWRDDLPSFVAQVRRYPNLRLCLSCRTTYIDAVLPDEFALPQVEHNGFVGVELEAILRFFAHWHLEPPSIPLLEPEYSNPLFLRMLCVGLSRADRPPVTERPPSLEEIVDLLLESTERAAQERLDVDRRDRLVHRAVDVVVDEMLRTEALHIEWARASQVVNALLPARPRSRSLLDFLLREGILREVQSATRSGAADRVRFGFERLGEFLVADRLLRSVDTPEDVPQLSKDRFFLGELESGTSGNAAGLLEALAILVPGRFGRELVELELDAPQELVLLAAVRSLAWRAPESFTSATVRLLDDALAQQETFEPALEESFALAARGRNPIGSSFVDGVLRSLPHIERDALLCPFIHLSWERSGVARRLSEWALAPALGRLGSVTALEWASALSWFCCAADRRVRDHATMALVALVERNPEIAAPLVERTLPVDDDYIVERVLLAVYAGLIRGADDSATVAVVPILWNRVFAVGPPNNALIRDYARCIVELAASRNILAPKYDLSRGRPPYGARLPEHLLGGTTAKNRGRRRGDAYKTASEVTPTNEDGSGPGWRSIRRSVDHDDFAVYTMTSALQTDRRSVLDLEACKRWILGEIRRLGFDDRFDGYDGYMLHKYGGGRGRPTWAERIGKKYQWIALYRLVGIVDDNVELEPDQWEPDPAPDLPPRLQAPGERNLDATILIKSAARAPRSHAWWAPTQFNFHAELTPGEWLDLLDFPDSQRMIELTDRDGREWLTLLSYPEWDDRVDRTDWEVEYRHAWIQLRSYLVAADVADRFWAWLRRQDLHGRWMPEGPHWIPYVFAGEYPWAVQARQSLQESESGLSSQPNISSTRFLKR